MHATTHQRENSKHTYLPGVPQGYSQQGDLVRERCGIVAVAVTAEPAGGVAEARVGAGWAEVEGAQALGRKLRTREARGELHGGVVVHAPFDRRARSLQPTGHAKGG